MSEANVRRRVWLALAPAMVLPSLAAVFYFVLLRDSLAAQIVYASKKAFIVVWPLVCGRFVLRTGFPRIEIRHPRHIRAVPVGVLLGLVIVGAMFAALQTPLGSVVEAAAEPLKSKAQELGFLNYFWPFALFLSLVNSLLEEYYWRWFVFGRLRRVVRTTLAHVLAGAAFASHHVIMLSQFFPLQWALVLGGFVGLGGVIWSLLYDRQETLAGTWVCHLAVDLGIMCVGHHLLFGTYL